MRLLTAENASRSEIMAVNTARQLEAARGYLMLDMPDHALTELRRLNPDDGHAFDIHSLRAEAYRQKKDHAEALAEFRAADDFSPDDVSVLFGMAWCLKRLDRLPDAIAVMERAYRVEPEEPVTLYNLACYFALAGDKESALSWLGRALRMNVGLKKLIPDEPDFDSLRNDEHFRFIVDAVESDVR